MILEQNMTGTVIGEMLGLPGNRGRVTFRILSSSTPATG